MPAPACLRQDDDQPITQTIVAAIEARCRHALAQILALRRQQRRLPDQRRR